jgi:hypothetical protein
MAAMSPTLRAIGPTTSRSALRFTMWF